MSLKSCFSVNKSNVKLWRSGNKIRTNATKKTVQPPECSSGGTGSAPLHIVRLHHQLFSLPSPCLLARHFTLFFYKRSPNLFFLRGEPVFWTFFPLDMFAVEEPRFTWSWCISRGWHDISIKHQPPAKLRGNKSSLRPESM